MRRLRAVALLSITLAAAASVAVPVRAAGPSLPALPSAAPSLPPGVRVEGLYRTAPVVLDGAPLFRIATLATGAAGMPAEMRADVINDALDALVATESKAAGAATTYDPETLHVGVRQEGDQALIAATDAKHSVPFPILTVTTVDAKFYRENAGALAERWRGVLQTALVAALAKRQPAQLQRNFVDLLRAVATLAGASLAAWLLVWLVDRRIVALEEESDERTRELESAKAGGAGSESDAWRAGFQRLAARAVDPELQLKFWRAAAALIISATLLAWTIASLWALSLFPQTAPLGSQIGRGVARIAFVWIAAFALARLAELAVARIARAARRRLGGATEDERTRAVLRIPTIARAADTMVKSIVYFGAGLLTLGALGLPVASVLTIGGVVAFALSFAAQNLVRDFLNGFLVLAEDQYVVGDYVTIGRWSGLVESMTLRIVKIRDSSGNLVTIPYGAAVEVVNGSRNWSRVDYRIAVAPGADVGNAIAVMRETIETMASQPPWSSAIVEPIEFEGVEAIGASGIVLRASLKTAPLRQFELKREINARILEAFRAASIPLGVDPAAPGILMAPPAGPA